MLPATHYKERERAKAQTRAIKACKDPSTLRVDTWLGGYRGLFPDSRSEDTKYHQYTKLIKFRREYGERMMASITVIEAQAWALAHPTHVRWLERAWDYAVIMQVAPMNIWKFVVMPPRTKEKRRAPTDEELTRILAACNEPPFEHLIRVAMHTGARVGGLIRVRRCDVDLKARRMILTEKGNKTRTVALLGGSYDAMLTQMGHRESRGWQGPRLPGRSSGHPSPAVFINEYRPSPAPWKKQELLAVEYLLWRVNSVGDHWSAIRGDFPHGFHSLRHYAAKWMRASGVDPMDIAIQLGHTDSEGRPKRQMVERVYAKPPAPDLDEALDRIAGIVEQRQEATHA